MKIEVIANGVDEIGILCGGQGLTGDGVKGFIKLGGILCLEEAALACKTAENGSLLSSGGAIVAVIRQSEAYGIELGPDAIDIIHIIIADYMLSIKTHNILAHIDNGVLSIGSTFKSFCVEMPIIVCSVHIESIAAAV